MMTSADFAWAVDLMRAKYGADGRPRALRQAEALRRTGRHRAASLWKHIATLLEPGALELAPAA